MSERDPLGEEALGRTNYGLGTPGWPRGSVRLREDIPAMKPGDDVVYVSDVPLFGCMELRSVRRDGRLLCRLDSGEFEVFEAHEISTVEALARSAATGLEEAHG